MQPKIGFDKFIMILIKWRKNIDSYETFFKLEINSKHQLNLDSMCNLYFDACKVKTATEVFAMQPINLPNK